MSGSNIIAVGYAYQYDGDLAVARYTAAGSLDTTFDGDGKATTDVIGNNDAAYAAAVQSDGKVVVAGDGSDDAGSPAIVVTRYNATGSLDSAFGGDGKVTTDSGSGHHLGYGVAAASGRILVGGWANTAGSDDFALVRFADSGSLDAGFAGGQAAADFGGGEDVAAAIAVQPDGKIVLVGHTSQGNNINFAVARFCPDGRPDNGANCGSPGFGVGGKTTTDFGGKDFGKGVSIQPDGDIVVAGYTRSYPASDFAVARYNADGSPDTSFDGDGKATVDFSGQWDEGMGMARQSDGKLVVVGRSYATYATMDFALARFCADGKLDDGVNCGSPAFGAGGKTTTDFFDYADRAVAVAVQGDGKIVVAGEARDSSNDFALARYCPDGKLDDGANCGSPAFGAAGKATTDFFGDWESLSALRLLPNGKILVGGTASRDVAGGGWDEDFALARYNPDGSLDSEFSEDGLETVDFGAEDEQGDALAVQADGKILVSGQSAGHLAVARFLPTRTHTYLPTVLR